LRAGDPQAVPGVLDLGHVERVTGFSSGQRFDWSAEEQQGWLADFVRDMRDTEGKKCC